MGKRTIRQQHIEQVAGIIHEGGLTATEARKINDGDGWGFAIRYDHEDYANDRSWTQISNLILDPQDLEAAIRIANEPIPTASEMGRRSQQAQREKLGDEEYLRRKREYARKGGRPRKDTPTETARKGKE